MESNELLRMSLILIHLFAFAAASAATAFGDFAIFAHRRMDIRLLLRAARVVAGALAVLWVSGLALIALDTGFAIDELSNRPKLLAKLSVALLLTLNGWALHRYVFPHLQGRHRQPHAAALWPTVAGAISAASWLCAAFIGVGKPLAPVLGYAGFMAFYACVALAAIALGLRWIRPRLADRLASDDVPTLIG